MEKQKNHAGILLQLPGFYCGVDHDNFAEQLFHAIRVVLMCGDGKEAYRTVPSFSDGFQLLLDLPEILRLEDLEEEDEYQRAVSEINAGFRAFMEGYVR